LRQEFRELEILDEITYLAYMKQLPSYICGNMRNQLINSYQIWKGLTYVPDKVPAILRWSESNPLPLVASAPYENWQILKAPPRSKKSNVDHADLHSKDFKKTTSHMLNGPDKFTKAQGTQIAQPPISQPTGLIWQQENYSCAYDSLFTILYHIYNTEKQYWDNHLANLN
ncbi:hypothetical protein DENSPDRAFT_746065, partial [Dentipellis sp. KUC8613]